ncbi:MAG: 30S ribosomal protein S6 [Paludibacteraceae bacterium]|nr:30S ribosomal protein S6 [Paludibacteraceae bacterium]
MLNHYETTFILNPVLSEDQTKEVVGKIKDLLTNGGAKILNEEQWGLRKLAYPIKGKTMGFYIVLQFDAEPTMVNTLETAYRRDERVIRFLTFRLDKYAFEYAEKRRNKFSAPAEQKAEVVEEEVVVEPEENKED